MSYETYIQPLRSGIFDPLCRDLGLKVRANAAHSEIGYRAAAAEDLCVWFEHDRGLAYLAVGAASEPESLCPVDLIAQRFPRIRALPEGIQRLTLSEQADFVRTNWKALMEMFAPAQYPSTLAWRDDLSRAFTARMARDG